MATRVHVEVKDDGSIGMNVNMVLDILLYTVDAVKEALLLCTKATYISGKLGGRTRYT